MSETFVIVGGGLAAASAATELREAGFTGRVVLLAEEPHLPYERPPLSKGYLLGTQPREKAFVHDPAWYAEHEVEVRTGTAASGLDLAARTVSTASGPLGYDRLLLATGSQPRLLEAVDRSGAPAAYLRTLEDSERLKNAFGPGVRVAVVGGGWIGLETAAAARAADAEVVLIETAALPLSGVLGPDMAAVFADLHRTHGVDLRLGTTVEAVTRDGELASLALSDGTTVNADLVVVGVGVQPRVEVAEAAGLAVGGPQGGVLVDADLTTSDPAVVAAGDVAAHDHPRLGRRVRVEHWDTALRQGRAAARTMLGEGTPYDRLPYFFTDQYDRGMEYVGHADPAAVEETVVRGDVSGPFTAWWVGGGRVLAAMHMDDWDATDHLWRLVGTEPDLDRLRDPGVDLADVGR